MKIPSVKAWRCPTEFCTTRPQGCIALEPECCERVRIYPEREARLLDRAARLCDTEEKRIDDQDNGFYEWMDAVRKWRSDWRKATEKEAGRGHRV